MRKHFLSSVFAVFVTVVLAYGQADPAAYIISPAGIPIPLVRSNLNDRTERLLFPESTWSIAYSLIDEILPEGHRYAPVALLGRFRLMSLGPLEAYAESQASGAGSVTESRTNYEFGMNFGLSYRVLVGSWLALYGSVGSGPHYITVETRRQASGFIFSDNFELGTAYYLRQMNASLHLTGRYRHISNAGLKEPNGGIDNFFLSIGITSDF